MINGISSYHSTLNLVRSNGFDFGTPQGGSFSGACRRFMEHQRSIGQVPELGSDGNFGRTQFVCKPGLSRLPAPPSQEMDALDGAGCGRLHPDPVPVRHLHQADHRRQRHLPAIHRTHLRRPAGILVPARKTQPNGLGFDVHHLPWDVFVLWGQTEHRRSPTGISWRY